MKSDTDENDSNNIEQRTNNKQTKQNAAFEPRNVSGVNLSDTYRQSTFFPHSFFLAF